MHKTGLVKTQNTLHAVLPSKELAYCATKH